MKYFKEGQTSTMTSNPQTREWIPIANIYVYGFGVHQQAVIFMLDILKPI